LLDARSRTLSFCRIARVVMRKEAPAPTRQWHAQASRLTRQVTPGMNLDTADAVSIHGRVGCGAQPRSGFSKADHGHGMITLRPFEAAEEADCLK
jgi:hypothetical protein